ncbi:MAG TPA: GNAT family N-acetyltransferase [Streptosporangiaceae bacterium]|nr:GNAT family N-acetyltransferase [Streptosporangiaceae bacterium]
MDHQYTDEQAAAAQAVVTRTADPGSERGLLREFWDEVLVEAFPPEELGAPYWQDDSPAIRTILALGPGQQVLGGMVGETFPQSRVLLISWVAVRRGCRGLRVGSRLMEQAARDWYGQPGQQLVLAEVDDPRYRSGQEQDPVERLRFYDRFGVRALASPYFQPSVGPGFPHVYHLFLTSFDAGAPAVKPGAGPGGAVDGQVVRAFLVEYLAASAAWCGHPGVLGTDAEWLLSRYDGSDIPLVPLMDYERLPDSAPPGLATPAGDHG